MKKWILISILVLAVGGLGYVYWKYYGDGSRPASELDSILIDNYEQDVSAKNEMAARELSFAKKSFTNLALGATDGGYFTVGYFPLTTKTDGKLYSGSKPKFTKEQRPVHRNRLKALIGRYDSIVKEASYIHRIPRIVIYGLMAIEHLEEGTLEQAEQHENGSVIGLMQTSVSTANDTLRRGILNKYLSKVQVDFFKQKIGKSIDTISKQDLKTAEINIHAASALLSVLISKHGLDDLHKVIFSYCQGEFKLSSDGTSSLSLDKMIDRYVNTRDSQGSQYLVRSLGVNGSFDILFNDLKITD